VTIRYTTAAGSCTILLSLLLVVSLAALGQCFATQIAPQVPAYLHGYGGRSALQPLGNDLPARALRGKAVLLYFGYTHCPDACPQALSLIAEAMRRLPVAMQGRVRGLFVPLDPRRDSPALLASYCRFFDPRILGITGSSEALARVAASWRVSYRVPDLPPNREYAVEHSTFIYLLAPSGRTVALFGAKSSAAEIAAPLRLWGSTIADDNQQEMTR